MPFAAIKTLITYIGGRLCISARSSLEISNRPEVECPEKTELKIKGWHGCECMPEI